MVSAVVLVTELEGEPVHVHELDLVGRTKTDVSAFPGGDVADDRLHERAQVPRGPVVYFEDNGRVAIVFYRHSFSEIVCGCHRKLKVES